MIMTRHLKNDCLHNQGVGTGEFWKILCDFCDFNEFFNNLMDFLMNFCGFFSEIFVKLVNELQKLIIFFDFK